MFYDFTLLKNSEKVKIVISDLESADHCFKSKIETLREEALNFSLSGGVKFSGNNKQKFSKIGWKSSLVPILQLQISKI